MTGEHEADPWLTYQQAASVIGMSPQTLRVAASKGELEVKRLSRKTVRIRRSWLDAWIERRASQTVN